MLTVVPHNSYTSKGPFYIHENWLHNPRKCPVQILASDAWIPGSLIIRMSNSMARPSVAWNTRLTIILTSSNTHRAHGVRSDCIQRCQKPGAYLDLTQGQVEYEIQKHALAQLLCIAACQRAKETWTGNCASFPTDRPADSQLSTMTYTWFAMCVRWKVKSTHAWHTETIQKLPLQHLLRCNSSSLTVPNHYLIPVHTALTRFGLWTYKMQHM